VLLDFSIVQVPVLQYKITMALHCAPPYVCLLEGLDTLREFT
jgi:hypothetical protein